MFELSDHKGLPADAEPVPVLSVVEDMPDDRAWIQVAIADDEKCAEDLGAYFAEIAHVLVLSIPKWTRSVLMVICMPPSRARANRTLF